MGDGGYDRIQRILIGIGLTTVGAFALFSLVPVGLVGPRSSSLFPSGNIVGPVGAALSGILIGAFGVSSAIVPVLLVMWGIWGLGALERREATRWTLFFAILLALAPPLAASLAYPTDGNAEWLAGAYGLWLGDILSSAVGWLGAALLLMAILIVGVIAVLGLGPFRAIARGAATVRDGTISLGRGGRRLLEAATATGAWISGAWHGIADGARSWVQRLTQRLSSDSASELATEPRDEISGEGAASVRTESPRRTKNERTSKREEAVVPVSELPGSELPPLELLEPPPAQRYTVSSEALEKLGQTLVETLRTFKVDGTISGRTTGPVVTQFEVVPASGVKVGKIASLADDLALALKAPSVRIIAPIPGKGAVGVEVPNPARKVVYLREILAGAAYRTSRAQLPLALGEDVSGRSNVYDLAQMPHLLIAGVTGSGKSVCINAIISSLIYRYTPEQLRLLLIDPKMVELGGYSVLPHLRHPVVTDNNDAAAVLKWLVYEMERRYEWLSTNGCRNLREFNTKIARGAALRLPDSHGGGMLEQPELLPYVVLVIDELADLMMTVQAEVERPLAYLAQKARATGIHLVVATQRPSVNVITGLIKANFPCRAAFRVASKVDSRTIIDQNGAETLLGNGDMLFMPPGQAEPVRLQGTFVSTEDSERLMEWYRSKAEEAERAKAEEDILEEVRQRELEEAELEVGADGVEDRDPLFRRAAEVVIQHQQGSTSLLQRRLKVGYGRAARIVDQLEQAGIVGPPEGSKPREVLVTLQDLERICTVADGRERV